MISFLLLLTQQPVVRVTVQVRREQRPVADATVRSDTIARATGPDGQAMLPLSPGAHRLRASAIGFAPESVDVVIQHDTTISIDLRSVLELETITVSATRTERRLEEDPARVEILAGADVAEKTEMRPADLTMLLSEMVGVRTQVTAPTLGSAVVRIQGLRGHYTLFLTDGLPLHGAQSGGLSLLQVPPLDLQQVEVIKGAASALYGPAALGGVVDLVSQRPGGTREVVFNQSSAGGSDGFGWVSQTLNDRWGVTVIGDAHHQDERDVSGDGWADLAGFDRLQLRPRLFWSGDHGATAMATASVMTEDRQGGTMAGTLAPDGFPFVEALTTQRGDAGVAARLPLGAGAPVLGIRASYSMDRRRRGFGSTVEHGRQNVLFGEASLSVTTRGVDWVGGLAWQRESFASPDVAGLAYTFTSPAAFLQVTASPSTRWTATLSGRCDAHNRYGTYCTPRLSTLFHLGGTWTLRMSGGTGFFVPTPFTEETEPISLRLLQPLTGLQVEKARNGSADLSATFGALEVSATFYTSVVNRAVMLRGASGDTVALVNNTGPTRALGAETFVVYDREPFVVTLHYSYVRATEVDPATAQRRDVPQNPRHNLFVDLAYEDLGQGRWVALEIDWTGRQALDNDPYRTTSRPYVVAGMLASQRIGKVKLFLSAQNITGVRQTQYQPIVLPARGPGGKWTTGEWAPLAGRVINGGVRLQF